MGPGKGALSVAPSCNSLIENKDPLGINNEISSGSLRPRDIFNHSAMRKLRKQMLNGEKPNACKVCIEQELSTGHSYRLSSSLPDDCDQINLRKVHLRSIDISAGDQCNLAYRMCHPGNSNLLREDLRLFRNRGYDYQDQQENWWSLSSYPNKDSSRKILHAPSCGEEQWEKIKKELKDLKEIKASGGESLQSKAFIDLLKSAISQGCAQNITLSFHTNGTLFSPNLVSILNQFDKTQLNISIDGVGKTYNYIRYPGLFNEFEKSLSTLLESSINTNFIYFNCVLSVYNVLNLKGLGLWALKFANKYKVQMNLGIDLINPIARNIDVQWLPSHILELALQKLDELKELVLNDDYLYLSIDRAYFYMKKQEAVKVV